MADIKRNAEREELFRTIYKIATELVHAGHVAEWDFKSYVLGTMFYRYISENFAAYINQNEIDTISPSFLRLPYLAYDFPIFPTIYPSFIRFILMSFSLKKQNTVAITM